MELGTFTPTPREALTGDSLKASEATDKPFVVSVREHKTNMTTKFKPNGDGVGVIVDVADVRTGQVWIDVLWMNGAIVDNLAPYVGQAVPIKLIWASPANGGNAYVNLVALEGAELAQAQQWATANPGKFDTERAQRQSNADAHTTPAAASAAPAVLPTVPVASAAPVTPAPSTAGPATPAGGTPNVNDPAVAALLQQLAAQQATG